MLKRISAQFAHDDVKAGGAAERTMGLRRTFMLWLAANMVVTTLLTGTLFVPGVSYGTAVLMIVLGTLVGVTVLALVGNMGTRTGMPTMVLTRGSFGARGGKFPAVLNLAVLMGWSWIQALLAGITVNYAVESFTGFSSVALFTVLCQGTVVLLALFGHRGIERIEPYLALVLVGLAAYVLFRVFSQFSLADLGGIPADPSLGFTPAIAFDVVVATAISWTVLSADFNRNAKGQRTGVLGTVGGYTSSTVLSMTLGATAISYAILSGGTVAVFDPTLLVENFGFAAALVVFLSVMATNTLVVYGMVMSYLNLNPRSGFLAPALVLGGISIVGALWQGILDRFLDFLFLIGTFFVPVFAIMLADYFILRRGRYLAEDLLKGRDGAYWFSGGFNPAAWAAYIVGAGLAFYWTQISPLSLGATLPVFFLTFALYLAISFVLSRRSATAGQPEPREAPRREPV